MKIAECVAEREVVATTQGESVQNATPDSAVGKANHAEGAQPRQSPDPLSETDRYRLVQPYLTIKQL